MPTDGSENLLLLETGDFNSRHALVTFILLLHDNLLTGCVLSSACSNVGNGDSASPFAPTPETLMKSLLFAIFVLLINLGCGGYGSGMGMTPAAAPLIVPAAGTYSTPLTVTITDSVQNAVIYVTVDGSMPSLSSPVYHGPFMITQSAKVQAIAAAGGYNTSPVAIANFTLQ